MTVAAVVATARSVVGGSVVLVVVVLVLVLVDVLVLVVVDVLVLVVDVLVLVLVDVLVGGAVAGICWESATVFSVGGSIAPPSTKTPKPAAIAAPDALRDARRAQPTPPFHTPQPPAQNATKPIRVKTVPNVSIELSPRLGCHGLIGYG